MSLDQRDLDGKYRVTTMSDYQGPIPMQSDGETEIINGQTSRVDKAKCKWNTVFTVLNENEVKMESMADPADAAPDFCLTLPNGSLTREPVTYTTILKVARKGDKIRLSGQIQNGSVITMLTMTKV